MKLLYWQTLPDNYTASIRTKEGGSRLSGPTSLTATQSSNMFHRGCDTLPYATFLKVQQTNNTALLVISGTPTPEQLTAAWENIITEYCDLIQTPKSESLKACYIKVLQTEHLLTLISSCVDALKMQYDADIAAILADKGYTLIEHLESKEAYLKQLYRVEQEAKVLIVLLNQYTAEYSKLSGGLQATDLQRSTAQQQKEISILSRFMGFRIDAALVSTLEMCGMINMYLEFNSKKQNEDA